MFLWLVSLCQFAPPVYAEDLFVSDVLCACASVFEDVEGCWCHLFDVAGFDEAQASCFFLLAGLGEPGVALLGAIDPAAVGVSSCLLMPDVRKVLAFGDSDVGCVDAQCYAVSLKGSAVQFLDDSDAEGCRFGVLFLYEVVDATLLLELFAGERWTAAVRLAWRRKGKITGIGCNSGLGMAFLVVYCLMQIALVLVLSYTA
ncbi:hypothetical protein Nepgr_021660 [Nepenthes gracilis]|uniref:Uncharacterized protein n=1 Tax=Nepenthes gracilis TaxID=150966 RepID=A0AAD3SZP2_NEPGR|nr:hypothetical protein Nepgr_021660 [Nepenthes gracilis]